METISAVMGKTGNYSQGGKEETMNKIKGVCRDCAKWKTEKCEERKQTGRDAGSEGWCKGWRKKK